LQAFHYRAVMCMAMTLAKSKLTAQGQISVPAEIRKKLGVGPGSVFEWDEQNDEVVARRAGRYSSEEIHHALFVSPAPASTSAGLKEGIRKYIRKRHARG
jgi:antitoxin PrlF